jgi:ribosome-interacting GTPase 1
VISVCKSADLLLMVLDASRPHAHRRILTQELESVGIRLNRRPPNIYFKKKKTGGVSFNATVPLTRMDEKLCHRILQVWAACILLASLLLLAWKPAQRTAV